MSWGRAGTAGVCILARKQAYSKGRQRVELFQCCYCTSVHCVLVECNFSLGILYFLVGLDGRCGSCILQIYLLLVDLCNNSALLQAGVYSVDPMPGQHGEISAKTKRADACKHEARRYSIHHSDPIRCGHPKQQSEPSVRCVSSVLDVRVLLQEVSLSTRCGPCMAISLLVVEVPMPVL